MDAFEISHSRIYRKVRYTIPNDLAQENRMVAEPHRRRWTRDEYHFAADTGLFRPTERLELLEGEVIEKVSPQSRRHAWAVSRSAQALRDAFGSGFHVREEK